MTVRAADVTPVTSHLCSGEEYDSASSYVRRGPAPPLFCAARVEELLRDVLDAYLRGVRYAPARCGHLAHDLCSVLRRQLRALPLQDYKLVTHVVIGQDTDQSVQVASRCLWNHDTDNFAAATYRNATLYAVAVVYGLHLDRSAPRT